MESKIEGKKIIIISILMFVLPGLVRAFILLYMKSLVHVDMLPLVSRFLLPGLAALSTFLFLLHKRSSQSILFICICSLAYGMSSFMLLQYTDISKEVIASLYPLLYLFFCEIDNMKHQAGFVILQVLFLILCPPFAAGLLIILFTIRIAKGIILKSSIQPSKPVFFVPSIISLGLSAYAWLPDLYKRFFTGNTPKWMDFQLFQNGWGILSRLFLMSGDVEMFSIDHGSNLFCGITVIILCVIYLFCFKDKKEVCIAKCLGMIGLFMLVTIRPLYDVISIFSDQDGTVSAFAFLPVFFILKEAALGEDQNLKKVSYKGLTLILSGIGLTFILVGRYAISYLKNESVFATIIVMVVAMMIVVFYRRNSIRKLSFHILISMLLFSELVLNTYDITKSESLLVVDENEETDLQEETDDQEISWDPFQFDMGGVPKDLEITSGLKEISIMQYDSGMIALDAHKVAEDYPNYITNYRFLADESGILYIKHGDDLKRYGKVQKGEAVVCKGIHESRHTSVEYECFRTLYVGEEEEQRALLKEREEKERVEKHTEDMTRIFTYIGCFIAALTIVVCVIFRKKIDDLIDLLSDRWNGRKRVKLPMTLMAFLLPLSILVLAAIYAGVAPFGDNSIWRGDGVALTMPTMFQARDQILRGKFLYSFSAGGGSNLYYFNPALFLFFWIAIIPEQILAEVIGWVILFKIALSGTSMYLYLKRKKQVENTGNKENQIVTLVFTTAYALSSYQLCMTNYFYWSDMVYLLPLILIAMENMLVKKKNSGYCLLLALAMILNCYNAIYICFFLALWFFTFSFSGVRDFLFKAFTFAKCSLLSAGMSFWVIFATFLSRKYGIYSGEDSNISIPYLFQSFWKTFRQFYILADPISGTDESGMANLYCGVFVIFLFLYCIFMKKKSRKLIYKIGVAVFVLLSTNTSTLDYIWNGFHYQKNMPGRYAFILVFILLDLAWETGLEICRVGLEKRAVIGSVIGIFAIVVLSSLFGETRYDSIVLMFLLCMIYAGGLIDLCRGKKQTFDEWKYRILFLAIAFFELIVNSCFVLDSYAEKQELYQYRNAAKWLKEYDPELSGLDRVAFLGAANANQGENSDLGSLGIFNSFLTPQQYLFGASLGMAATSNLIRDSYNLMPIANALGRVKYIFVPRYIEASGIDLEDYEVVADINGIVVMKNDEILPEAFWIDSASMDRINTVTGKVEFYNVLSGIYSEGDKVLDSEIPLRQAENNENRETNTYFTEGNIYENFVLTDLKTQAESSGKYYYSGNCYANLGQYEDGEEKDLELILLQPEEASLIRFDKDVLDRFVMNAKRNGLTISKISDGKIEGEIKTEREGYLCIPIPYEAGWQALVNGVKMRPMQMRNGMMAVKLDQGENIVDLTFMPVGFFVGILVTLLSIILLILLWIIGRMKAENQVLENHGKECLKNEN